MRGFITDLQDRATRYWTHTLAAARAAAKVWDAGLDFTGFEIDKEYFTKQEEAFASYVAQLRFADTPAEQPAAEQLLMPL